MRGSRGAKTRGLARQKKRGSETMEKGQVWSIDVLLAVVIFVSIIIIFYLTLGTQENPGLDNLQTDAKGLAVELQSNPELGFIEGDEVNQTKLDDFANAVESDYQDVKEKLGLKVDFCIYYVDEQGNLVLIGDKVGVGSGDVKIADTPCGEAIP